MSSDFDVVESVVSTDPELWKSGSPTVAFALPLSSEKRLNGASSFSASVSGVDFSPDSRSKGLGWSLLDALVVVVELSIFSNGLEVSLFFREADCEQTD